MYELTPEDQALIDRIKAAVHSGYIRTVTDDEPFAYPPATPEAVASAEEMLGFRLPALIREIYLQVGNGGFGPAYGIFGLEDGKPIYEDYLMPEIAAELLAGEADEEWQDGFIPYCEWGGNIETVVDCASAELPVYVWKSGVGFKLHSTGTLHEWWKAWLKGHVDID